MNSPTEKVLGTNSHYFVEIYNFSVGNFCLRPIVWPKFAKTCPLKYAKIPKSSTYGALQPKPWVAFKHLIYHFVPYNLLNKLSVHHNSLGSIFFELHGENWIFVKIRKNFSFTSHSERKNDVAQKILTPRSYDWQIICSVDCREQNGILSFWMLPMVWAAGPRKWNFSVFSRIFTDKFWRILAKLLILDKNFQLNSFRSSKNNGSLFPVFLL